MHDAGAFDYIVVGAGSAGCVLASRLSADPARRVLLLEAGRDARSLWLRLPVGYFRSIYDERFARLFPVEPQPQTAGREMVWPRGRVLGGSSAINGLLYIRGQHEDFDDWARLGGEGWGYRDVLPWFRRSERYAGGASEPQRGLGELQVSDLRNDHPYTAAWVEAAVQAGLPRNPDFNGARSEGVGAYQLTIGRRWRCDAATAFLRPVLGRPNLTVITGALATDIEIEDTRARGVRWLGADGPARAQADAEVVLAAGAIQSPQLLQLSGIGGERTLARAGVRCRLHRPEVGRGLQDHYQARVIVRLRQPRSLNDAVRSPVQLAAMGLDWLVRGRGPLTVGAGQVGGLARTPRAEDGRADILFNVMPLSVDKPGDPLHRFSGFSASAAQCRPRSRGTVDIVSADPRAAPRIVANYLDDPHDARVLVAGLRMLRDIYAQPAFRDLVTGDEYLPGRALASDAALQTFARERGGTVFHPAGTCRMGGDDDAVVDARLRVRGVERLRVVDASVMPTVVSTNTNAATIMIAEKGAAMILDDAGATAPR